MQVLHDLWDGESRIYVVCTSYASKEDRSVSCAFVLDDKDRPK